MNSDKTGLFERVDNVKGVTKSLEAYPETKFFDAIQKMNAEMLLALEQINLKANT